ncbi:MAG: hypothetical protein VX249_03505, partial [Pseudomonadota bacterium]|nr:hypothetical protein [Pseudomonadota bacterium]
MSKSIRHLTAAITATVVIILLVLSGSVPAVPPANAPVRVTAEATYDGLEEPETASMDLIVELLPSAPTLSAPADQQIEIDSAGSTTVSYSYTITTKANGSDIYDLTAALVTTNLSGSPVTIFQQGAVPITSVTLGATAAVANSPAGAKSIPVPTDGTVDDLVNGIQADDSILVHGINHKVNSVTDNGVTATISLTPAHDSEVLAGDLITESQTFELLISDI